LVIKVNYECILGLFNCLHVHYVSMNVLLSVEQRVEYVSYVIVVESTVMIIIFTI